MDEPEDEALDEAEPAATDGAAADVRMLMFVLLVLDKSSGIMSRLAETKEDDDGQGPREEDFPRRPTVTNPAPAAKTLASIPQIVPPVNRPSAMIDSGSTISDPVVPFIPGAQVVAPTAPNF